MTSRGKQNRQCPRTARKLRPCIDSLQIPTTQPHISSRPCQVLPFACRTKSLASQNKSPPCPDPQSDDNISKPYPTYDDDDDYNQSCCRDPSYHNNNQQDIDESINEDIFKKIPKFPFYTSTPKRTNIDDEENTKNDTCKNKCSEGVLAITEIDENASLQANIQNNHSFFTPKHHGGKQTPSYRNTTGFTTPDHFDESQSPSLNSQGTSGFSTPKRYVDNQIPNYRNTSNQYPTYERYAENQSSSHQNNDTYLTPERYGGKYRSTASYAPSEYRGENQITSYQNNAGYSTPERYVENEMPIHNYKNNKSNEGNVIFNDINESRIPLSESPPQNIVKIPVSSENYPLFSSNTECSMFEPNSCRQHGSFQKQSLDSISPENERFIQAPAKLHDEQTSTNNVPRRNLIDFNDEYHGDISKIYQPERSEQLLHNLNKNEAQEMCNKCCGTSITVNDNNNYQNIRTSQLLVRGAINNKNINKDKTLFDSRDQIGSAPKSSLNIPANNRPKSANVSLRGASNKTILGCGPGCGSYDARSFNKIGISRNVSQPYGIDSENELRPAQYKSQSRLNISNRSKPFESSVPTINGSKNRAVCCDLSTGNVKMAEAAPECMKSTSVQKHRSTLCASDSCVAKKISGCGCQYPPAYKQFSCTGNINGTCSCSDNIR